MFHGLTMVNFDGQTQNQMIVRPWSAMVDHGQPWSDGQTVAGRWPGQDEMIGLSFGLAVDVKWKEGKSPAKVLRFVRK